MELDPQTLALFSSRAQRGLVGSDDDVLTQVLFTGSWQSKETRVLVRSMEKLVHLLHVA